MVKKFLLLWFLLVPSAWASFGRPINIEQLTVHSERIVVGTVLSNSEDYSGAKGIPAIVTRVKVEEMFKGSASGEVSFRQAARKGPRGKLEPLFYDLPRFTPGERVVVFLPAASDSGFASPFALGQGVFRFRNSAKGDGAVIANESGNRSLSKDLGNTRVLSRMRTMGLEGTGANPGALNLGQLRELVRTVQGVSP